MAGITERNKQKNELASIGFSLKYIDEWQPKTTLYRHKPSYSVSGEIAADVGTSVKGVPGNPDYVLKKSRIGLFPWQPSETCTCKWCMGRRGTRDTVAARAEGSGSPPVSYEPPLNRGSKRFGPHLEQSQA
jgi:hypothetical protein